jgi:non-ribosomal peptide synthetase component F
VWQRQWLQGPVLETQLDYWTRQLEGSPLLRLPSDRPRPAVELYRRSELSFELPAKISDRLKSLSRQEGVTLFMTLLAGFQTLLYRYTGQDDIVVGTPIANRNRAEIEGLIGFFVNTLALRIDLSGDPTFRELVKRVRDVTLNAYAHQDLPFERVIEELQPERDKRMNPLFQILFVLQNSPMSPLDLPGITINKLETNTRSAMFDIMMIMVDSGAGLIGYVVYNIDMFEQSTITRMADHFKAVLEKVSGDADVRLLDIPIVEHRVRYAQASSILQERPFEF